MQGPSSTMQTVRRLYLYLISGVSLAIIALGMVNLFGLAFDALLSGVTGHDWVQGGPDWERNRLSLYVPLVAIATPIWLFHWRMIQRARHGAEADIERRSVIRTLYLTAILVFTVLNLLTSLRWTLQVIGERLLGRVLEPFERNDIVQNLAAIVVIASIWAFHWKSRDRDVREGPLEGVTIWLPRLYLYAVSAVGAILLMVGASTLMTVAAKALIGSGETGKWWDDPLANGLALALTGGPVWLLHWSYSARLLRGDAWWAYSERESRLRRVYLVALTALAAVLTLVDVISGIERAIWEVLDSTTVSSRSEQVREIVGPPVIAIPFIALWVFHRMRLFREARANEDPEQLATMQRTYGYSLAFVGLALLAGGLAALIATVSLWIAGTPESASMGKGGWQGQVALGTAAAVSGGSLWLWHWYRSLQRMAQAPAAEQASTVRRAYLFAVVGGTVVPLIISLAIIIYQVLQRVLNVAGTGSLAVDIDLPVGIALIATAGAAYHGLLLYRDQRTRPAVSIPEAVAIPARLTVIITGPAGADLPSLMAGLRDRLPAGYDIKVIHGSARDVHQPISGPNGGANGEATGTPDSRQLDLARPA